MMGFKCHVPGCEADSSHPKYDGVTFHKVPDFLQREQWLDLCRIPEDIRLKKQVIVCSCHFRNFHFVYSRNKFLLKRGVLPTVFPWTINKPVFRRLKDQKNNIIIFRGSRLLIFDEGWLPCTVLTINFMKNKIFVKFDDHLEKINKWIQIEECAIRPLNSTKFVENHLVRNEKYITKAFIINKEIDTQSNQKISELNHQVSTIKTTSTFMKKLKNMESKKSSISIPTLKAHKNIEEIIMNKDKYMEFSLTKDGIKKEVIEENRDITHSKLFPLSNMENTEIDNQIPLIETTKLASSSMGQLNDNSLNTQILEYSTSPAMNDDGKIDGTHSNEENKSQSNLSKSVFIESHNLEKEDHLKMIKYENNRYICPLVTCLRNFKCKDIVDLHLKYYHTQDRDGYKVLREASRYQCPIWGCWKIFNNYNMAYKHLTRFHAKNSE